MTLSSHWLKPGCGNPAKGRFHSGQALDWSRLDFRARRAEMRHVLREAWSQRVGSKDDGGHLILKLAGVDVLLVPDAIPATRPLQRHRPQSCWASLTQR